MSSLPSLLFGTSGRVGAGFAHGVKLGKSLASLLGRFGVYGGIHLIPFNAYSVF